MTLTEALDRGDLPDEVTAFIVRLSDHSPASPMGLGVIAAAALIVARDSQDYGNAAKIAGEFGDLVMAMIDEMEAARRRGPAKASGKSQPKGQIQ